MVNGLVQIRQQFGKVRVQRQRCPGRLPLRSQSAVFVRNIVGWTSPVGIGCWLTMTSLCHGQSSDGDSATGTEASLLDIVFSGGWIGFAIVILLLALSMTAAYLVFEQLMTLRRSELIPAGLDTEVQNLLQDGRVAEATTACRNQPSFLSFVLLSGLTEANSGWPSIEKALEDATAEHSARLFRKVEYLSVIGNIAPMVGLLGTVTGMILAFQRVAATQGTAGAAELAEGIYQALITTVGGLIVAIPSLGAFAIFRNRIDQLVAEAAYAAQRAFSPLKRRRAHDGPGRRPPPPPPPPPPRSASTDPDTPTPPRRPKRPKPPKPPKPPGRPGKEGA